MSESVEIGTWVSVGAAAVSAVVTIVLAIIKSKTQTKLAAIAKGGHEAERVVADATPSFQINTEGMSETQKFEIVKEEITRRDRRHARQLYAAIAAFVIFAIVAIALALIAKPAPVSPESASALETRCREYKDSLFIGCICGKCEGVIMKDVDVKSCTITLNGTRYENQNSDEWVAQCIRSGGPEKWTPAQGPKTAH